MTDTAESLDPLRLPLQGERLIEASAGTGKTFTIAALYLRLLLGLGGNAAFPRPLSVEELLVVTFTEAATAELRGRIRTNIHELRIACLRQALQQQPLRRVSVLRFNPGQVRVYQLDSFSGELFAALGLSRPASQNQPGYGINHFSRERIAELDADPDVRCAILTGEGAAFSAGGDIDMFHDLAGDAARVRPHLARVYEAFHSVEKCAIPVVAAVNGLALTPTVQITVLLAM